ncbi:DUF3037 domain-containing protein [Zobellia barbeyronii]|uniref:DUF3037 domain-containing protein n=1 Tax=Zobellia barbeyronii TaxID=2748009 RepID=A0ABS5W944_9FLAO|nr:DUF3037 domain-containing protein [Zobellia barbeyronii]MBT2159948.1 DUF3037 domain-containing protein [Zobellia barbeyronii]
MQDRVTYEFAIIRLVPRVEREEFINVGAIVFSKRKKFLKMRFTIDRARIKAFASEVDAEAIEAYLKAWELVCEGESKSGAIGKLDLPSRFRWLTASRSTIIQSSKPHPGLCLDPQKELDSLFKKHVL